MPEDALTITNNQAAHQYETRVDGHLARLVYRREGDVVGLTHTEVPVAIERRGIGGRLVRAALDDARAQHLRIVPRCPFVGAYIERHPEYRTLVAGSVSAEP